MADNNTELRSDIQHGLDDNPHNDAEKAAALGGLGGAAVGAAAGSVVGPVGTIVGAIAGGLLGAGASGLAVGTVDQFDNDNTVSGLGDGTTSADVDPLIAAPDYPPDTRTASSFAPDAVETEDIRMSDDGPVTGTGLGGHNIVTGEAATSNAGNAGLATGAVVGGLAGAAVGGPLGAVIGGTMGSLMGGVAGDAVEAADDQAALGDDGTAPYLSEAEDWEMRRAAVNDVNAASTIPLGESTVGVPRKGDPDWNFGAADFDEDSSELSSTQTDYRAVDEGLTSVGATDENADEAVFSNLEGGVRSTGYDAEAETERVGTDFDSWSLEQPNSVNDAPGIHPENMTTAGALNNQESANTETLSGDDRDKKRSGNFSNDAAYHTDLDIGTSAGG